MVATFPISSSTMASICSSSNCPDCASAKKEWDKIEIGKKRLALKEESFYLEKELDQQQKQQTKINNKLANRNPSRNSSSDIQLQKDWQEKEKVYLEKIRTYEQEWLRLKLEKEEEDKKREQELSLKSTALDTDEQQEKLEELIGELTLGHEQELENFKNKLFSTQKSLAELFVERDRVQRQRDELQDQLNNGGQAEESEVKSCADCGGLKEQAEMLENDLSKLNSKYKREQISHSAEKQKWHDDRPSLTRTKTSEEMQQLKEENSYLLKHQKELETELEKMEKFSPPTKTADNSSQEELQQLKDELKHLKREHDRMLDGKEELEANLEIQKAILKRQEKRIESSDAVLQEQKNEWQEEKKNIMRRVEEQNHQVEDWRLAVPRSKLILEQEQVKNGELEKRLEETMRKLQDQEQALEDSMKTKEALIKQRERHQKECQQFQKEREELMLQKDCLEGELLQRSEMAVSPATVSPSVGESCDPFVILIPADIPSSTKKHVTECDWSGENNLSGKFTGWMDAEGKPDGHGTLRIEDGSIYAGEWLKGERHGAYFVVVLACFEDWCGRLSWTLRLNLLEQGMEFTLP